MFFRVVLCIRGWEVKFGMHSVPPPSINIKHRFHATDLLEIRISSHAPLSRFAFAFHLESVLHHVQTRCGRRAICSASAHLEPQRYELDCYEMAFCFQAAFY